AWLQRRRGAGSRRLHAARTNEVRSGCRARRAVFIRRPRTLLPGHWRAVDGDVPARGTNRRPGLLRTAVAWLSQYPNGRRESNRSRRDIRRRRWLPLALALSPRPDLGNESATERSSRSPL